MTLDDLPPWAAALLDEARVAHLGLLDGDGAPRVQPVTYARAGGVIWSAVDDKPKRVPGQLPARLRRLRADPRVALTVDRYAGDWSRLAWVQVLGDVTLVGSDDGAASALAARYPQYGDSRPGGPLLRLAPRRVLCWHA